MSDPSRFPLKLVDASDLDSDLREILRPGEFIEDSDGRQRRLPNLFYEVTSWEEARGLQITPSFALWEFLDTDVREAEIIRKYPRYVPCAITLLAANLEVFRQQVGSLVHVAANGGYRSPGHALSHGASPHMWGTAANIYKIGNDYIDTEDAIDRYSRIARNVLCGIWARPYGPEPGLADDHLHLDLGCATLVPHEASSEIDLQATGEEEEAA